MKTERELFLGWHYGQYLLENPDVDLTNAKYIYDYAHRNPLVYQMRETCFIVWQASASREGYKLVPVEPSEDIIMAGCMEHGGYDVIDSKSIYKAMVDAIELK